MLLEGELEAGVYAIRVLAQAHIAIMWVIQPKVGKDGHHEYNVTGYLFFKDDIAEIPVLNLLSYANAGKGPIKLRFRDYAEDCPFSLNLVEPNKN